MSSDTYPPGSPWSMPPMPPAGGSASATPPPGGAAAAFKWGAIFGLVAAVPNLLQVLASAAAVNANSDAIDSYVSAQQSYQNCLQSASDPTSCTPPQPTAGVGAVALTFYGTCLFAFLITLVIYLFAGRAGARAAQRRGPGIWAAVVAAAVGSVWFILIGVAASLTTGRTGLDFGIIAPNASSGTGAAAAAIITVIADLIGLVVAIGLAALMGLWGASLGAPRQQPAWSTVPPVPPTSPYGAMPPYPPPYPPSYPGYPATPPSYPGYPPYPGTPGQTGYPGAPTPGPGDYPGT